MYDILDMQVVGWGMWDAQAAGVDADRKVFYGPPIEESPYLRLHDPVGGR